MTFSVNDATIRDLRKKNPKPESMKSIKDVSSALDSISERVDKIEQDYKKGAKKTKV